MTWLLLLLLLALTSAFTPSRIILSPSVQHHRLHALRAVPVINNWTVTRSTTIEGRISKHPTIKDGEKVTTSKIASKTIKENVVVETVSGSKYKLGQERKKSGVKSSEGKSSLFKRSTAPAAPAVAAKPAKPAAKAAPVVRSDVDCTNAIVDRQWSIVKNSGSKSPSGKSRIYSACKVVGSELVAQLTGTPDMSTSPACSMSAGVDFTPDTQYILKCSSNSESMDRESKNYDRINGPLTTLLKWGAGSTTPTFVKKYGFLKVPKVNAAFEKLNRGGGDDRILVLEKGVCDLKVYLRQEGKIRGKELREILAAVTLVCKGVNDAGLVWTDLKVENLVVCEGKVRVKGIDLESAIPVNTNPVDYSPEACPPEFARSFIADGGVNFIAKKSYDSWSLGMLFYNIYTNRGYFENQGATGVTKALAIKGFKPDFRQIDDERLRDLMEKLCDEDPGRRPSGAGILLHPFFTKSGIGKWSF
ncbi:hypothetical protein TrLO_g4253 [Triparma laevis f. longispina]|uniref:Protein kinase domain-containing protein n=1 Tax=Triparma laevis f. longispina TaxID=1714387 RepID=A0A9W7DQG4_9STRA|nr:hypothetical protein TrLO_g4253 [Triparma laevis f. longispina]